VDRFVLSGALDRSALSGWGERDLRYLVLDTLYNEKRIRTGRSRDVVWMKKWSPNLKAGGIELALPIGHAFTPFSDAIEGFSC